MQYSIEFCLQTIEQYIVGSFFLQMLIISSHDMAHKVRYLGDNCIVFENFTASIGDLMVGN